MYTALSCNALLARAPWVAFMMHHSVLECKVHAHNAAWYECHAILLQGTCQHAVKYTSLGCCPTCVQWLDASPGNIPTIPRAKTRKTAWTWHGLSTFGGDVPVDILVDA